MNVNLTGVTDALVLVVVIGLAVYDVLPALSGPPGDTISEAVQNAIYTNVALLWALAVLLGHFSLPRTSALLGQPASVLLLAICAGGMWILGGLLRSEGLGINRAGISLAVTAFGLACAHYLWPMRPR